MSAQTYINLGTNGVLACAATLLLNSSNVSLPGAAGEWQPPLSWQRTLVLNVQVSNPDLETDLDKLKVELRRSASAIGEKRVLSNIHKMTNERTVRTRLKDMWELEQRRCVGMTLGANNCGLRAETSCKCHSVLSRIHLEFPISTPLSKSKRIERLCQRLSCGGLQETCSNT